MALQRICSERSPAKYPHGETVHFEEWIVCNRCSKEICEFSSEKAIEKGYCSYTLRPSENKKAMFCVVSVTDGNITREEVVYTKRKRIFFMNLNRMLWLVLVLCLEQVLSSLLPFTPHSVL